MDELDDLLNDLEVSMPSSGASISVSRAQYVDPEPPRYSTVGPGEEDLESFLEDLHSGSMVQRTPSASTSGVPQVAAYQSETYGQPQYAQPVTPQYAQPQYAQPVQAQYAQPVKPQYVTPVNATPTELHVTRPSYANMQKPETYGAPQTIHIEAVTPNIVPERTPEWGGINKHDTNYRGSLFSNYVEPPKPEHLVEDPREHQVNAIVKKIIQTIQGPSPPATVQALKTIPNLARSACLEANLRSMRKGQLVATLLTLMNTNPNDSVIEFAGKAIEALMNLSPDGCLDEITINGGLPIIAKQTASSIPVVALQAMRLLAKLAKKSSNKRTLADQTMVFVVNHLSGTNDALRHQAVITLYYLFDDSTVHYTFVNAHGAPGLVALVNGFAATQLWVLGTIGKLASNAPAFTQLVSLGLSDQLQELLLSRSPVVQNLFHIVNNPSNDVRAQMLLIEKEVRPVIEKQVT